ncbi:unnamed protein product [Dovyalis caffra]|uniref:Uncharacterized protein n=1 Tax=Dovyalis caffra TaxID=77055 RepID=A0AAV1SPR5_9ROSI|nr:unnamed protein product [Dovyalis caffra]
MCYATQTLHNTGYPNQGRKFPVACNGGNSKMTYSYDSEFLVESAVKSLDSFIKKNGISTTQNKMDRNYEGRKGKGFGSGHSSIQPDLV